MKKLITIVLLILLMTGCTNEKAKKKAVDRELVVYSGEAFFSSGLWSGFDYFEARYDCKVKLKNFDDPYLALHAVINEGDSAKADVICSIPTSLVKEALDSKLFLEYTSSNLKTVDKEFYFDKTNHFTPYAYGYLGLLYDRQYIQKPPRNYGELQDNRWDETLLMPHPISTGAGRAFVYHTAVQYGRNGFRYLWKGIRKNILLYCDTYNDAYNRFLAGEGHLLPGYTTQHLFHELQNPNSHVGIVVFEEGTSRIMEFAGVVASSQKQNLAKHFVDYLLTEDFQSRIAGEKYLYPLRTGVEIPVEFSERDPLHDKKIYNISQRLVSKEEAIWLKKIKSTLEIK